VELPQPAGWRSAPQNRALRSEPQNRAEALGLQNQGGHGVQLAADDLERFGSLRSKNQREDSFQKIWVVGGGGGISYFLCVGRRFERQRRRAGSCLVSY
jgi:hypothetical protein